MAWEIVDKNTVSKFIRVPSSEMVDIWYEMTVGLIEEHTGWILTATPNITERVNGRGADYITVSSHPIASVDEVILMGSTLPVGSYSVSWDRIQLYSYRGDDVTLYNGLYWVNEFPFGVGNIQVTYSAGGYNSLPNRYKQAVRSCVLMVCKEYSTNFRGEGSDQMYKKYRPDRTQNPEEVLLNYGQHGKIMGILKAFLPAKRIFA